MDIKEQLITNIKDWIKLDGDITRAKAEIKQMTAAKKTLTDQLVLVMKTNSIDCFDINTGALVLKQQKVKKAINTKSLLAALQSYYKTDVKIAEELAKHIMDSRAEEIKDTIKHKIN